MAPTTERNRVQIVGGTTAQNDSYVGPSREVTVDVNRQDLRIHDGKTPGGTRIPNLPALQRMFLSRTSEFGLTSFASDVKGFLVRTADKLYRLREIAAGDGMTVENPDAVAGDPTIRLPDRLKRQQTPINDADDATESGFYLVTKGAASNLPAEWLTTSDVFVQVMSYTDTVDGTILQIANAAQTPSVNTYFRIRQYGVFTAWQKREDPAIVLPTAGTLVDLVAGVNQIAHTWTARQLSEFVRKQLIESIQFIDSANAAKAYSYNQLFALEGSGLDSGQSAVGPFNLATNDRVEIVAGATARKIVGGGESVTARVEVEHSDLSWNTIATHTVTTAGGEDAKNATAIGRFIKTATGYQIVDANWAVVTTVTATMTGRFRVTYGIQDQVGARAARWR